MFKKNTIRTRVMKVIEDRIARVQVAHDNEVKELEDAHADQINTLTVLHEKKKDECTMRHVDSIIGNIL